MGSIPPLLLPSCSPLRQTTATSSSALEACFRDPQWKDSLLSTIPMCIYTYAYTYTYIYTYTYTYIYPYYLYVYAD